MEMITSWVASRYLLLLITLSLTGCAQPENSRYSDTSTTEITPTIAVRQTQGNRAQTPSPIATLIARPTWTPTPNGTPLVPTPGILASRIGNNILFAPANDPLCELPCWQGLRIGKSSGEDVQTLFDNVFGFNGTVNFLDRTRGAKLLSLKIPGVFATGYVWRTDTSSLGIYVVMDDHEIVQGIKLDYLPGATYRSRTAQQIITRLGAPSDIYVDLIPSEAEAGLENGFIRLFMIYREGMAFMLAYDNPSHSQLNDNVRIVNFCLDAPPVGGFDYLVGPLDNLQEENLTPLQNYWILDYLSRPNTVTIDQKLGVDIEQFVKIAARQDPCISIPYEKFN